MKPYLFPALLALVFSSVVNASTFAITDDELDPEVFPDVAESIRSALEGPEAPAGLTDARKEDVLRSLDRLEALLLDSDDSRSNRERVRGLQARINTHLLPQVAKNDTSSEVVCRRVKKIGSNIPVTECRTREEIERERHLADEEVKRIQMQGQNVR